MRLEGAGLVLLSGEGVRELTALEMWELGWSLPSVPQKRMRPTLTVETTNWVRKTFRDEVIFQLTPGLNHQGLR